MPPSTSVKKSRLKYILVSVIIALGILILGPFWFSRLRFEKKPDVSVTIQNDASIIIDNIQQSSIRDGKKEWSLKADRAQLFKAKNQALLTDLSVTFFMENKSDIYLTAQNGILNTKTKDIQIYGNVIIHNDEAKLLTEKLNYDHKRRILTSNEPVKITGDTFQLQANSLIYFISTKQAILEGRVEGLFGEEFVLF
jgi:LPS export ABC transporter protein LptC